MLLHNKIQEELRLLRDNYSKQELLVRELTKQRDHCRQLYDQQNAIVGNSGASSASADGVLNAKAVQKRRESIDGMQNELIMWKTKADRLQETLKFMNEDRQTHEK